MDLQKAKILIDKINSLHKSMGSDADGVAAIEKDLMLSYIRQLYEVFLSEEPVKVKAASKVEIIKSSPKSKPRKTTRPKPVQLEVITPDEPEPAPEPVRPAPPKPVRKAPRVIQVPDAVAEEIENTPVPPPPASKPKPKPTPPAPAPKPKASPILAIDDDDLAELFEEPSTKELSDKLSNLPIRDLRKAMGLNEKIFTINELFAGDASQYDKAMVELNALSSFDEAKVYMIEQLAGKFDWAKRGKKKKAKNFIKLVRRRYS